MTQTNDRAAAVRLAATKYVTAKKAPTMRDGKPGATKEDIGKIESAENGLLKAVGQLIGKTVTAK